MIRYDRGVILVARESAPTRENGIGWWSVLGIQDGVAGYVRADAVDELRPTATPAAP